MKERIKYLSLFFFLIGNTSIFAQQVGTIKGNIFLEASKEVLETTPPEVLADIMQTGIVLTGGGALIHGLKELFENYLKLPVFVAEEPLSAVVYGTQKILDNVDAFQEVLLRHHDDLPPR